MRLPPLDPLCLPHYLHWTPSRRNVDINKYTILPPVRHPEFCRGFLRCCGVLIRRLIAGSPFAFMKQLVLDVCMHESQCTHFAFQRPTTHARSREPRPIFLIGAKELVTPRKFHKTCCAPLVGSIDQLEGTNRLLPRSTIRSQPKVTPKLQMPCRSLCQQNWSSGSEDATDRLLEHGLV